MFGSAAVIIELFGPPAAGKTTLARTLAAHLRRNGRPAQVILSFRPAEANEPPEGAPTATPPLAAMRRVARPALELLAGLGHLSRGSARSRIAAELLEVLPPATAVSSLRLRQYLTRLESSWRLAEQAQTTVIFDQGFVQGICSLVQCTRAASASAIEKAVALMPKADQWISIQAPRQLLQARLEARRNSQSWIERRFELDTQTSLGSIEILQMLESILQRRDARITRMTPGEGWPEREFRLGRPSGPMAESHCQGVGARR